MDKRIKWIDYTKAFACLLVCIGHLIQSLQKASIDNNIVITSLINWLIYIFHMPLFIALSGTLYQKKKKEFSWKQYKIFVVNKIINLAIPYFFFYLLYLGINICFSNSVNTPKGIEELIGIFNNPMSPYWFLYALLSVFLIIPVIEKLFNNDKKIIFILLSVLKIISIFINIPIYFIKSIMSYGVYFYLGTFIDCDDRRKINKYKLFLYEIFYLLITIIIYLKIDVLNNIAIEIIKVPLAIIQIMIIIELFKQIEKNIVFDTFKKYTFQIFVLHTIFAAGIRIILLKFGITYYFAHFIIGIVVSIYIPVLIGILSEKLVYTDFFFYPIKTLNIIKERKNERKKA